MLQCTCNNSLSTLGIKQFIYFLVVYQDHKELNEENVHVFAYKQNSVMNKTFRG